MAKEERAKVPGRGAAAPDRPQWVDGDRGVVWGRPVGIAVAGDGSLLVTDDGAKVIWRATYTGK